VHTRALISMRRVPRGKCFAPSLFCALSLSLISSPPPPFSVFLPPPAQVRLPTSTVCAVDVRCLQGLYVSCTSVRDFRRLGRRWTLKDPNSRTRCSHSPRDPGRLGSALPARCDRDRDSSLSGTTRHGRHAERATACPTLLTGKRARHAPAAPLPPIRSPQSSISSMLQRNTRPHSRAGTHSHLSSCWSARVVLFLSFMFPCIVLP
jgi:hypothetical protein